MRKLKKQNRSDYVDSEKVLLSKIHNNDDIIKSILTKTLHSEQVGEEKTSYTSDKSDTHDTTATNDKNETHKESQGIESTILEGPPSLSIEHSTKDTTATNDTSTTHDIFATTNTTSSLDYTNEYPVNINTKTVEEDDVNATNDRTATHEISSTHKDLASPRTPKSNPATEVSFNTHKHAIIATDDKTETNDNYATHLTNKETPPAQRHTPSSDDRSTTDDKSSTDDITATHQTSDQDQSTKTKNDIQSSEKNWKEKRRPQYTTSILNKKGLLPSDTNATHKEINLNSNDKAANSSILPQNQSFQGDHRYLNNTSGFTKIPLPLVEEIYQGDYGTSTLKILLTLARFSLGFNKETAVLSKGDFSRFTHMPENRIPERVSQVPDHIFTKKVSVSDTGKHKKNSFTLSDQFNVTRESSKLKNYSQFPNYLLFMCARASSEVEIKFITFSIFKRFSIINNNSLMYTSLGELSRVLNLSKRNIQREVVKMEERNLISYDRSNNIIQINYSLDGLPIFDSIEMILKFKTALSSDETLVMQTFLNTTCINDEADTIPITSCDKIATDDRSATQDKFAPPTNDRFATHDRSAIDDKSTTVTNDRFATVTNDKIATTLNIPLNISYKYLSNRTESTFDSYILIKDLELDAKGVKLELERAELLIKDGLKDDQLTKLILELKAHGIPDKDEKCQMPFSYLFTHRYKVPEILERIRRREDPDYAEKSSRVIRQQRILDVLRNASATNLEEKINQLNDYERKFLEDRRKVKEFGQMNQRNVEERMFTYAKINRIEIQH